MSQSRVVTYNVDQLLSLSLQLVWMMLAVILGLQTLHTTQLIETETSKAFNLHLTLSMLALPLWECTVVQA